ncbi:MAG TPA: hypothetical protein VF647_08115 [Longimicrobium sp.]|jgi:hypothetical protein
MTPNDARPSKSAKVHTNRSGVSYVKADDVLRSENGRRAIEQSIKNAGRSGKAYKSPNNPAKGR